MDNRTIAFYSDEAEAYTSRDFEVQSKRLNAFMHRLPAGGSVLELGCGAGQDSRVMLDHGFDVTPTDGTSEIAAAATKYLGQPVSVLLFDDLKEVGMFDGVWANACLLHVPRGHLAGIITRIFTALKPGGVFYASYKAGEAEGRDRFERYFNYPSTGWLHETYFAAAPWAELDIEEDEGGGYDQVPTRWLHATATKPR
ncbi:MAG: hypothetical protein FD175_70 [Beijerinckiaceae bacterium]|nr:MAG: hypothetical protein FD175_70 [Beijerinckiaceae bacterium]